MEVEYEITLDDLVEFNMYALKHHPELMKRLKSNRICLIATLVISPLAAIFCFIKGYTSFAIFFLSLIVISALCYWYFYTDSQLRKKIKKAVLKEHVSIPNEEICRKKISISETGINTASVYGEGLSKWSAISEIVRTDDYIYLSFKPGKAQIIPKRAFINDAAFNQFAQTARMYHSKASVLK